MLLSKIKEIRNNRIITKDAGPSYKAGQVVEFGSLHDIDVSKGTAKLMDNGVDHNVIRVSQDGSVKWIVKDQGPIYIGNSGPLRKGDLVFNKKKGKMEKIEYISSDQIIIGGEPYNSGSNMEAIFEVKTLATKDQGTAAEEQRLVSLKRQLDQAKRTGDREEAKELEAEISKLNGEINAGTRDSRKRR